jgi:hypothetical protein
MELAWPRFAGMMNSQFHGLKPGKTFASPSSYSAVMFPALITLA